jgi:hypothetical protein
VKTRVSASISWQHGIASLEMVMRRGTILLEQLIDWEWVLSVVLNCMNSLVWSWYICEVWSTWLYSDSEVCNWNTGFVAGFSGWWQTTLKTKGKEGRCAIVTGTTKAGGWHTLSIKRIQSFMFIWITTCLVSSGILMLTWKAFRY